MGYYTRYRLIVDKNEEQIIEFLLNDAPDDICSYGKDWLAGIIEDPFGMDPCKWYEHDTDMIKLSKHFPEVLFSLSGKGEESGDIWIKYFQNGKSASYQAQIIMPALNMKDMK